MSLKSISLILTHSMGLDPSSIGEAGIERAVQQQMSTLGLSSLDKYLGSLQISEEQVLRLIEAVVVSETWFFREPTVYAYLRRYASREWPAHKKHHAMRVASIGCSSGEEPYTQAMTLFDCGLGDNDFHIIALDINRNSLDCAKQGIYTNSSFRSRNLSFRDKYFESGSTGFRLEKRVQKMVTFVQGNVLDLESHIGVGGFDVIFCRNLLIYLTKQDRQKTLVKLDKLLSPTGYLCVGHSEANLFLNAGFRSVPNSRAFSFKKPDQARLAKKPKQARKKTVKKKSAKVQERKTTTQPPEPKTQAIKSDKPQADKKNLVDALYIEAKILADQGKLKAARIICEEYLDKETGSANGFHLLAMIHEASGNRNKAQECCRKAVYLNPGHQPTLFQLSQFAEQSGDVKTAERLRIRATRATTQQGGQDG